MARGLAVLAGAALLLAAFPVFAYALVVTGEEPALGAFGQAVTFALVLAGAGAALAGLLLALGGEPARAVPLLAVALLFDYGVYAVPLGLS